MSDNETSAAQVIDKPKRETKSYMTLYTGLQSRVDTALLLLGNVTADKGSTQLLDAVRGLLRGSPS